MRAHAWVPATLCIQKQAFDLQARTHCDLELVKHFSDRICKAGALEGHTKKIKQLLEKNANTSPDLGGVGVLCKAASDVAGKGQALWCSG